MSKEQTHEGPQLMTTDVMTVSREAALKEAAHSGAVPRARVSGLVVTDADGNLEGVITEADFVKAESDRRADKRACLLRFSCPSRRCRAQSGS